MKQIFMLFLLFTSLFLSACNAKIESKQSSLSETNQSNSPEFIGYVTKIENQRALVVSSFSKEINQTRKEFYDAVWVSNIPSDVKVGEIVHVWFEGELATSYPGQGKAAKVKIAEIKKPEKAILSPDEIIRKALTNKDISNVNILVVKEVNYDEKSAVWTLRYKSAMITDGSLEELTIQVPDR